ARAACRVCNIHFFATCHRLIPRKATTARGSSHQAAMWAWARAAVTIRAAITAAAIRQSSPITKSYQKRAMPLSDMLLLSGRGGVDVKRSLPAECPHQGEGHNHVEGEHAQNSGIAWSGPGHSRPFSGP